MSNDYQTTTLGPRFTEALAGAVRLHAQQVRKGTSVPYVSHLLAVASIALEYGATEDEAIAALLHDAIEDASESLGSAGARAWIESTFGAEVLAIVEGCTDADTQPKAPWPIRKAAYIAHASEASPSVVLVAASDKLHNVRAVLSDYRDIGDDLWARFNRDAGKAGTIGFYRGVVSAFQQVGHHPRLIRDLDDAVRALENAAGHRGVWPPVA